MSKIKYLLRHSGDLSELSMQMGIESEKSCLCLKGDVYSAPGEFCILRMEHRGCQIVHVFQGKP